MTPPLILGAGPAGCAAALVLAKAGAAPVLLDRSDEVGDALCGGFLSWRTTEQLRALGVDPTQLDAHPVDTLALFTGARSAQFSLPRTGFGLSRHALDSALRQRALAAGAKLEIDVARGIEGTSVIGRRGTWRTDSLFLATGKHDLRGVGRPRSSRDPAVGLRLRLPASVHRRQLLQGRIELHLFAGGYAGILLQEDGTANVCLAVRKSRLAGDPAGLLSSLVQTSPALAERLGSDWRSVRPDTVGAVPYGYIARPSPSGLFRLGDQAAVIPSLAGEGMGIALSSGVLAAQAWVDGGPATSAEFQRDLARHARPPVRTATLAWHLAEQRRLASLGIALAVRIPPLVTWLMNATRLDATPSLAPASLAS